VARAFVMSCRVFQRRVEHAFLSEMAARLPSMAFDHEVTQRNTPFVDFLTANGLDGEGAQQLEPFARAHADDRALFEVVWQ
jgi:predicted enzyme involved in methoxymalonyl-ACP biosynthesis